MGKNEKTNSGNTLNPGYSLQFVDHYGVGKFPVHVETGEVCECEMEWNEAGTVLSCSACGLEGT